MRIRFSLRVALLALVLVSAPVAYYYGNCTPSALGRLAADEDLSRGELAWVPTRAGECRLDELLSMWPRIRGCGGGITSDDFEFACAYFRRVRDLETFKGCPHLPHAFRVPSPEDLWNDLAKRSPATRLDQPGLRILVNLEMARQIKVDRDTGVELERVIVEWKGKQPARFHGRSFTWAPGFDRDTIHLGILFSGQLSAAFVLRPGIVVTAVLGCCSPDCIFRGSVAALADHRCEQPPAKTTE